MRGLFMLLAIVAMAIPTAAQQPAAAKTSELSPRVYRPPPVREWWAGFSSRSRGVADLIVRTPRPDASLHYRPCVTMDV
jgi:hypothetical protein